MSTSDNSTEAESSSPRRDGLNRWPVFDIEFLIEGDDEGGDQCTLYPRRADDEQMATAWVTASEGSFVSLAETR